MLEHRAAQQQNPQEFLACTKYGMSTSFVIINVYLPHDGLTIFLWKGTHVHLGAQLCTPLLIFYDMVNVSVLNYVKVFYICKKQGWRPSNVRPKCRDTSSKECDIPYKASIPGKVRHQSMDQYGCAADNLLAY